MAMQEILDVLGGQTVKQVTLALHGLGGQWDTDPDCRQGFWLHLGRRPPLQILGDNTATDIVLRWSAPFPSRDFGRYGGIRVEPAPPAHHLAELVGHQVVGAALVTMPERFAGVGVQLTFDHAHLVVGNREDRFVFHYVPTRRQDRKGHPG